MTETIATITERRCPRSPLFLITLYAVLMTVSGGCSGSKEVRADLPFEKRTMMASWYGADFHGRPTSSGEIFNMHGRTCAHKELPFGTRLAVTHIASGKTVECVVNDRGPFIEGRDLDLSYGAAKEIGLIGPGTAAVAVEVTGRDTSYVRKVKVQTAGRPGPVAIQVGSFTESIKAIRLKRGLGAAYGNVYIQEAEMKGVTYYRVRVGNFESITAAMPTAERLGQEGYPVVVMRADVKI